MIMEAWAMIEQATNKEIKTYKTERAAATRENKKCGVRFKYGSGTSIEWQKECSKK
jgi:hypothetical protein